MLLMSVLICCETYWPTCISTNDRKCIVSFGVQVSYRSLPSWSIKLWCQNVVQHSTSIADLKTPGLDAADLEQQRQTRYIEKNTNYLPLCKLFSGRFTRNKEHFFKTVLTVAGPIIVTPSSLAFWFSCLVFASGIPSAMIAIVRICKGQRQMWNSLCRECATKKNNYNSCTGVEPSAHRSYTLPPRYSELVGSLAVCSVHI